LLAAAPAAAQVNPERESQDRSRRVAPEARPAETVAPADEVSFAEVLKSPGDVDLNERYAREQILRGDLRGAALTLERVLILAPGRDRARMLYAAVLYRLDALADAERELRLLESRPAVAEEAKAYLKLVEARKRRNHFDARVFLGYGFDDNRNSASDSDQALFFGRPIVLNTDSRRRDDTYASFGGALGYSRDFGGARPQKFFLSAGYFRSEQTLVDTLDLQAYSVNGGLSLRWRGWELRPFAGFDHVLLSQSTYLRSASQGARLSRRVLPRVEAWVEARREAQDFVRTRYIPTATDRTGDQVDYSLGAAWAATPRDRFGAALTHRRKLANARAFAYRRESVGLDYTRLLGRGMFLGAGLVGQFDRYDEADRTIAPFARQDDAVTASLMFGAPLDLLWKPLKGFTGTLGVERFQQTSNQLNYDYSNNRLSAMLAYKWGI
jgi:hypothetical protein